MSRRRENIGQGVRFNVLRRDGFTCRYCGRSSPDVVLHIDHLEPHSRGGSIAEDNLVTACGDCNMGKGAKLGVLLPPAGAASLAIPVGLYGHSFKRADQGVRLHYQFKVQRCCAPELYVVQLFSWLTGDATTTETWSLDELHAPLTRLYDSREEWIQAAAAHQESEKRGGLT